MRRILALSLLALVTSAQSYCKYNLTEELEAERRDDTNLHDCRACRTIDLDAGANCPQGGYDCQESFPMTSNVLSAGDCGCAQLRCRDAKASLAVEGSIVGRLRCKNRKWMVGSEEATSAICAVKKTTTNECAVGVCPEVPPPFFVNNRFFIPLIVSPPDAQHPCAWGDCQLGAVAKITGSSSEDLQYLGKASFACARDGTWTYIGPEAEKGGLKEVKCIKKECYFCLDKLISITTNAAGSHAFKSDIVDKDGSCAVRTLTCEGTNANIEINGGAGVIQDENDGIVDGIASFQVTCDASGKQWMAEGLAITQLECASTNTVVPVCQSCAKELITITGEKEFTTDTVGPNGDCSMRTLTCTGINANIEFNGGDNGGIDDGDDGVVDGVARVTLNCDAGGKAWMLAGVEIKQLECAAGVEQRRRGL